ncbi:MAG: SpoIID/LytB domain-containing protein [Actinomycetota bacterium]
MRGGGRAGLLLTGCALVAVVLPPPAAAKGRRTPVPVRGWVVDRVRIERLDGAGGHLTVGGSGDFLGAVEVVPGAGGVAVVNELPLEEYLQGVAEVPASWPVEALRAQAIAARTFALHELRRAGPSASRAVGADICAVEACQVYIGLAKQRAEHGQRWVDAVGATRGQVLLHRGEPILAQYSSSNGGRSVAGGRPYLRSGPDPDSARGPYSRWRVTLAYDQLRQAFDLPGPLTSLRRAGEAVALDWAVPGGAGGQAVVAVADFRARLNEVVPAQGGLPRTVPSTQFSVLADDPAATAVLDGRGHGHGIGMSQFGALGKASRGMRAADILASYYGGLRPTPLPADLDPGTVRVALDTGRAAVSLGASGRFRVLDGAGMPVAVAASGTWRVLPAGKGRVRVVAPPDQEAAPALERVAADPPGPVRADRGQARFRLSSPAVVRLRVEGPGLDVPVETAAALVEPGEATAELPALPGPGRYTVSVVADGGAGRTATATLPLRVRPTVAAAGRTSTAGVAPAPSLPRSAAVAWALLASVGALLVRRLSGRTLLGTRP